MKIIDWVAVLMFLNGRQLVEDCDLCAEQIAQPGTKQPPTAEIRPLANHPKRR